MDGLSPNLFNLNMKQIVHEIGLLSHGLLLPYQVHIDWFLGLILVDLLLCRSRSWCLPVLCFCNTSLQFHRGFLSPLLLISSQQTLIRFLLDTLRLMSIPCLPNIFKLFFTGSSFSLYFLNILLISPFHMLPKLLLHRLLTLLQTETSLSLRLDLWRLLLLHLLSLLVHLLLVLLQLLSSLPFGLIGL